ncbi:MAG TPA: alpha/beta hydrolase [Allosphingosinicella sp.]|nr:alpha/beta hydrolase [Allosphingosinicella sp.]
MADERAPWRSHPKDARFSEWTAPDGARLRRMEWPAAAGSRKRGRLLFAGGRGDFIEKYLEAYAHWRGEGWDVTAFDWRGQGRSRGSIVGGNLESFDVLIDDLDALIGEVRPRVAIGHSMGGHMLLRTLVERRPALDAAVLVAPMIGVNSGPVPSWLAPTFADTMCRLGYSAQPMFRTPRVLSRPGSQRQHFLTGRSRARYEDELFWWREEPGFNLGAPSWGWLRAAFRSAAAAFTPERLATVDLPVLVLGTERDRLVSPSAIRRVARLLPRAELLMFPRAAHELLREADPVRREALARIDAFLAGHAG